MQVKREKLIILSPNELNQKYKQLQKANCYNRCYSPYELIDANDICSNLINEYFSIELINPKIETFYVPYLKSVQMASGSFVAPKASAFEQDWNIIPFII